MRSAQVELQNCIHLFELTQQAGSAIFSRLFGQLKSLN